MCGILGGDFSGWDYRKGISSLHHRGPDGNRVEKVERFTLAFTRLAIQDLSIRGMQPMSSADGKVWLLYNGEIYGFEALKRQLKEKYSFQSTSDTEVILAAYLIFGDAFIDKIDGMFAIAILDLRERHLKLYRDRVGIKPLFYHYNDEGIAFASELKAMETASQGQYKRWHFNRTAFFDYLYYGYIPAPKTMYENCYELPPAHCLVYDIDRKKIVSKQEYWQLKVNCHMSRTRRKEDIAADLRDLIHQSVKEQLISDVPVGTFLSGGIDSSIVTYEAAQWSPNIEAFSIGFQDKAYDESRYAKEFAEKYHINLETKMFQQEDFLSLKTAFPKWYDEPFADTSSFPTYFVSELARKKVTVVLTGDGGDELFGGYQRYRNYVKLLEHKKIDSYFFDAITKKMDMKLLVPERFYTKWLAAGVELYKPYIFHIKDIDAYRYHTKWNIPRDYDPTWYLRQHYQKDLPPMTRACYLDFKTYLPGDILTKVDRTSMSVSLESRVPLLSRTLVEYAFSLSSDERCDAMNLKRVLKESYQDVLGEKMIRRKKRGFSIPPYYRVIAYKPITEIMLKVWQDYKSQMRQNLMLN